MVGISRPKADGETRLGSHVLRPSCPTCGESVVDGSAQCSYCQSSLAEGGSPIRAAKGVRDAVNAWGRSVFGAPSKLGDLVTKVGIHDEAVERVFTEIVRREIREERMPTQQRRPTSPR